MTDRSTKAGTEAPATPPPAPCRASRRDTLNKGRDRSPGNTVVTGAGRRADDVRSTKAGTEAPATRPRRRRRERDVQDRSTKAGTEAPATHIGSLPAVTPTNAAQQRPGPKPRQHATSMLTKSERGCAQQRPGPKPRQHTFTTWPDQLVNCAQQRPGPKPRQHLLARHDAHPVLPRSTKAGTEAPATPRCGTRRLRRLRRSTKAGTEAPATPAHQQANRKRVTQRSTKAGTEAPATLHRERRFGAQVPRSTKAGTEAPATPGATWRRCTCSRTLNKGRDRSPGNTGNRRSRGHVRRTALNKGRDRSPGNTSSCGAACPSSPYAQQRPGPKPRQHNGHRGRATALGHRSTKAGTEAPATHVGIVRRVFPELRSTKAGTEAPATLAHRASPRQAGPSAQQRPGPKPRQHGPLQATAAVIGTALNKGRDRSPGNTETPAPSDARPVCAQQRPGPKPRQHFTGRSPVEGGRGRSTKAGTEAPATLLTGRHVSAALCARSTKAGTEAPATPMHIATIPSILTDAQQRPGPKPRQHPSNSSQAFKLRLRSTKAGTEAPATLGNRKLVVRPGHRSTKAGTEAPATLHAVVADVDLGQRSTKAGTEAPATRRDATRSGSGASTLNKGRDRSPGNTGVPAERPVRRHSERSTKAGTEAPATPAPWPSRGCPPRTAQQRPGPKPRQHADDSPANHASGVSAQQRPGPKPRQHTPSPPWTPRTFRPLNKGRDRSPGNTRSTGPRSWRSAPLNKGRDRSPGNTPAVGVERRRVVARSTKAGTEAPATPMHIATIPSILTDAQQRPGPKPRQHLRRRGDRHHRVHRSTKAGTEAPATPGERTGSPPE